LYAKSKYFVEVYANNLQKKFLQTLEYFSEVDRNSIKIDVMYKRGACLKQAPRLYKPSIVAVQIEESITNKSQQLYSNQ
jgi:hypothetical protein